MLTGRDALFSIEQAISRARTTSAASTRRCARRWRRPRGCDAKRPTAFARSRGSGSTRMVRDQVIGDLDADRAASARDAGRPQAADRRPRAPARSSARRALDKAEAAKHDRDQDLADALEALDELADSTAERIKGDAALAPRRRRPSMLQRRSPPTPMRRHTWPRPISAVKGKPYDDDPLFMYLWNKKHGQAEDTERRLRRGSSTARSRASSVIGTRAANYAMLKEIPARLREHAKNKQSDVERRSASSP